VAEFWDDMAKGRAPLVMMKNGIPNEVWREKNRIALDFLQGAIGDLSTTLSADAWLGLGVK